MPPSVPLPRPWGACPVPVCNAKTVARLRAPVAGQANSQPPRPRAAFFAAAPCLTCNRHGIPVLDGAVTARAHARPRLGSPAPAALRPPARGLPTKTQASPQTAANAQARGRNPAGLRARAQMPMQFGFALRRSYAYSHSMLAGGLVVMSYSTRLTPLTSPTMRVAMRPSSS